MSTSWSDASPTSAGWYWYRETPEHKAAIVQVDESGFFFTIGCEEFEYVFGDHRRSFNRGPVVGQWQPVQPHKE